MRGSGGNGAWDMGAAHTLRRGTTRAVSGLAAPRHTTTATTRDYIPSPLGMGG